MVQETGVQYQVESYQRLKNWYLKLPCLTLSIIKYGLRVKRSNPGKGLAPFPTLQCSSYWKGAFGSPSTKVANFTYYFYSHLLNNLIVVLYQIYKKLNQYSVVIDLQSEMATQKNKVDMTKLKYRGTLWEPNSLVMVCQLSILTIKSCEVPLLPEKKVRIA